MKPVVNPPYVRSMKGWYRRDPFFIRYMARECTAFAVLAYAIVLTVGVLRLAQGEAAFNGWLAALHSPLSIAFHVLLLIGLFVHAKSWFEIMPKTMPALHAGGRRVEPMTITRAGWAAAALCTLLIVALAYGVSP
jgi:fumarate reductase subunit C